MCRIVQITPPGSTGTLATAKTISSNRNASDSINAENSRNTNKTRDASNSREASNSKNISNRSDASNSSDASSKRQQELKQQQESQRDVSKAGMLAKAVKVKPAKACRGQLHRDAFNIKDDSNTRDNRIARIRKKSATVEKLAIRSKVTRATSGRVAAAGMPATG